MPTLREYKKRLKSAETISQLSGAMRSASMAKYMKLSAANDAFAPYAEALEGFARTAGGEARAPAAEGTLWVLLSGNHGLCGGYHHELFSFFSGRLGKSGPDDGFITCGQKGYDFCRTKKLPTEEHFRFEDIPAFDDARALSASIREHARGRRVVVVYQRFYNMLKCLPETAELPAGAAETEDGGDLLFIPDRRTVTNELIPLTLASKVYSLLLSASAAAQASTVIAMRSAFDNASSSIEELETRINRLRQAAVTASVLETSADIKE